MMKLENGAGTIVLDNLESLKIAEKLSMSLVIMNPARRDQRTMMI